MMRQLSLAAVLSALFIVSAISPVWAQYAPTPYYPYQYYYYPYANPPGYYPMQPQAPVRTPRRVKQFRLAPSPELIEKWKRYQYDAEFRNRIRSPNNPETEVEYMLRSFW